MKRATLFDFHHYWTQERNLVEDDFHFLLQLLKRRQIRPHIDMLVDENDFPSPGTFYHSSSHTPPNRRIITGAVVCEPWKNKSLPADDDSCCSSISYNE